MSDDKLLTIAVPTYNRAGYLDQCLSHIAAQLEGYLSEVELLVSNNCSSDETEQVVARHTGRGVPIRYVCNSENIGVDRNFLQCFNLARGNYVLVFGDDDILLEGALDAIVPVLRRGDYGVVHLRSYGFQSDYAAERPANDGGPDACFDRDADFLKRVNYWITFASGNIVNKSLLPSGFEAGKFLGTNLVQVYWFLAAMRLAPQNVCLSRQLVAAKAENSGGYSVCRVFGTNLNLIMNEVLPDPEYLPVKRQVNRLLLRTFLPGLVLSIRKGKAGFNFEDRKFLDDLRPLFRSYLNFWLHLAPVSKLPLPLAGGWHLATRTLNKAVKIATGEGTRP
jgi:abequosyltransferase